MDFKSAKRMEPFSQYAVAAAKEAYEDAGLDISKEDPYRAGVIIGSGIGSLQEVEKDYEKILTKGPSKVNPLMVPLMISNMAAGNVSIQLGFKGKCTNVVTACATGTNCIGGRSAGHPVWRCGYYSRRGNRELYLPDWCGGIYQPDSPYHIR